MALSDEDVEKQIKHMIAFIDQEASEKVEEIDAKSEEDFNIEKGRIVNQQRVKITEFYEKKLKDVELQKKILASTMANQGRLKILQRRQELVLRIIELTRQRLVGIVKNKKKYQHLLELLILQGLYQLVEGIVLVAVRKADKDLVVALFPQIQKTYKEAMEGRDVNLVIDQNFLPENITGGIQLYDQNRKIKINNTLESRLDLLAGQLMPKIRVALFGKNPNRKFNF